MKNDLTKNWQVFPGFELELFTDGFDLPVNIAFVTNPEKLPKSPLCYVTELYGQIKVITNDRTTYTYANDLLNYKPDYKFPGTGESGVTGICIEPKSGDLFVTMLYMEGNLTKNKLIRTKSKDGLKMDTFETIIDDIPSVHAAHQIQMPSIGFDGKLYVNIGDGMIDSSVAQDDKDLRGKILRMNLDGTIPRDNPKPDSLVFAKGLRNPFGGTWRKSNKSLYISDNGPDSDDRIAKIEAGKNYGWPKSMRQNSIFWWEFTQAPTAITFSQDKIFPSQFDDQLFVCLYGGAYHEGRAIKGKKIVKLDLNDQDNGILSYDEFVTYVGDGPESPCGLAFGPGGLYFTTLFGDEKNNKSKGAIYKIKKRV